MLLKDSFINSVRVTAASVFKDSQSNHIQSSVVDVMFIKDSDGVLKFG